MSRASDALVIARGEVRDGIAAIEHFLQVLASRRVGPRVLARSVPEMEAGCEPLRAALAALADAVALELHADPAGVSAVRDLLAHAGARVAELSAALAAHAGAAMDARARLALEAIVRRIAGELGAVMRLAEMLGAPVTSETTIIDFADALAARRAARPGATLVRASVELRATELRVGDARLVLELLELSVATVVRAGVTAPWIVVESGPEGFPIFTVEAARQQSGGAELALDAVIRDELPREAEVMRAAAQHAGIALTIADGGRKVTIAL